MPIWMQHVALFLLRPFGLRLVKQVEARDWYDDNGDRRMELTGRSRYTIERLVV